MALHVFRLLLLCGALLCGGCASTQIPRGALAESDPDAIARLTASQRAHGSAAFGTVRDLNVRYAESWGALGPRLHSAIADRRYRRESDEALDLNTRTTLQLHKGPGGRKFVFRGPDRVTVWYNGQAENREEAKRAAALNADTYKLFLLGPHYFQRGGVTLSSLPPATVEGHKCDRVLAVLQPGFGFAEEDRAVLSIDRASDRLRRVQVTVRGLSKTKNTELDVTFADWASRGGVIWPARYQERARGMLTLATREWRLLDLKVNRGFAPQQPELMGEVLGEAAQRAR
ncbi:MAG: hypothetical protein JWQ44_942 [Chthoniobacter sp.]|jgi:hypothetical protein|nr:hypothetical protein [Chthoniobacter sp.]